MLTLELQTRLALEHVRDALRTAGAPTAAPESWPDFDRRLGEHFPALMRELAALYGQRDDFLDTLRDAVQTAWAGWSARSDELRALDLRREADPGWFQSQQMLGGVCYVDLYCGNLDGVMAQIPYFKELGLTYLHLMPPYRCPEANSDGGYAVSSYREVQPHLGTIEQLRTLAAALRKEGISLVLDFIFNHTSDEHEWALAARAGDPVYQDYYYLFPDRSAPDAYERTVREIFPDEHPGAFTQLPDGRWVWTTFHSFQWDLNYGNPKVFCAMAGELLWIANLGAEILRMDAVAFIWKQLGTSCENLPQAHTLIRAFNALSRIAASGLLFKSEAIVHPDDVMRYISPQECQISYNPLQMALLWNSLATREIELLQHALETRHALPPGTAWVNYVRSHDDIGWTFADEDAQLFGIDGFDHRQFLNRFYVNRFPGSFARGVPFQDNPVTGDCRISGTCGSLVGLEQGDPLAVARVLALHSVALSAGGIPLIYLGDEVGTLNDPGYLADEAKAGDSRWVHRPRRAAALYDARADDGQAAGRIFLGLRRMIEVRRDCAAFAGNRLTGFRSGSASVLGYTREGAAGDRVLVLVNFGDREQLCPALTFSAMPPRAFELLTRRSIDLQAGLALAPYEVLWLSMGRAP